MLSADMDALPVREQTGLPYASTQTPSVFWFVGGTDPQKYAEAKRAGRIRRIGDGLALEREGRASRVG